MQLPDLIERIADLFQAGGEIMIPLLMLSLAIWTLAIVKSIRLLRERRKECSPEQCLRAFKKKSNMCETGLAKWQWDILSRYMDERCEDSELNREILESIRMRQESQTVRYISTILILAAIAPLLGLLGTVTGMIATFDVISQFGTGNARALASGIAEALLTTQSGLIVAVPGLIMGTILFHRSEKLKSRMKLFCIGLQEQTDAPRSYGE